MKANLHNQQKPNDELDSSNETIIEPDDEIHFDEEAFLIIDTLKRGLEDYSYGNN